MSAPTFSLLKTCGYFCSLSFVCASAAAGDLLLQKVPPIALAQTPTYPENLARYYYGAQIATSERTGIADVGVSSNLNDTNTAAALLCEDPTVGYVLPAGSTTLLVSFPKIENIDTISFLNEGATGTVRIAISNAKLPADSPQWHELSQSDLNSKLVQTNIGPAEAKYVRLTFDVSERGRIAGFGIYSTPALSAFTLPRARNFGGEQNADSFGLISYNLSDVHAKARALYVSSGDDLIQANNMIDGQAASSYRFAADDSTPTAIVDLGKATTLRRISAIYAPRNVTVDFYVLQSLADSPGNPPETLALSETLSKVTPVGSVRDEGLGRAAVDFPETSGRYILVKWTPASQQDGAFSVAEISAFGKSKADGLIFAQTAVGNRARGTSDGKTIADGKDIGLGKDAKEIPAEAPPGEGPPAGLPQPPPFVFIPLVQVTSP